MNTSFVLGNLHRHPRNLNEILEQFKNSRDNFFLAGDLNIDLLKINVLLLMTYSMWSPRIACCLKLPFQHEYLNLAQHSNIYILQTSPLR